MQFAVQFSVEVENVVHRKADWPRCVRAADVYRMGLQIQAIREQSHRFVAKGAAYPVEDQLTWDVLLRRTGAPGIHFEDYPELQGMELPEWSHLTHADAERYTAALYKIIARDVWPETK